MEISRIFQLVFFSILHTESILNIPSKKKELHHSRSLLPQLMHIIDKSNDNSFQDQKSAQHVIFRGGKYELQLLIFFHFGQTEAPQISQIDCTMSDIQNINFVYKQNIS
jgi:hypothetical protein